MIVSWVELLKITFLVRVWFHHRPVFLESRREVPVARAAFRVSWMGLTTFASGLYHVMSREG